VRGGEALHPGDRVRFKTTESGDRLSRRQGCTGGGRGHSMQDIVALLEEQTLRTHVFAALDTLEYLKRSGR